MVKRNALRLDLDAVRSGRWFPTGWDGFEVKVASLRTPGFLQEATALLKEEGVEGDDMESAESTALIAHLIAKYLLLGWRGLENDDGTDLDYTVDEAVELLTDPAFDHVGGFVIGKAKQVAEFFSRETADAAKN